MRAVGGVIKAAAGPILGGVGKSVGLGETFELFLATQSHLSNAKSSKVSLG